MGDHYRNRLTHTLEVSQIARSIGKVLNLNDELIEAIALGHDLGHTPFGHIGEKTLHEILMNGSELLKPPSKARNMPCSATFYMKQFTFQRVLSRLPDLWYLFRNCRSISLALEHEDRIGLWLQR